MWWRRKEMKVLECKLLLGIALERRNSKYIAGGFTVCNGEGRTPRTTSS
jgi:hypothetical protein